MKDNNDMLHGGKLSRSFIKPGPTITRSSSRHIRKKAYRSGHYDSKRTDGDAKMGVLYLLGGSRARLSEELSRPDDAKEGLGDKKIIAWITTATSSTREPTLS